eukprot:1006233-Rhodomonas_salina.2
MQDPGPGITITNITRGTKNSEVGDANTNTNSDSHWHPNCGALQFWGSFPSSSMWEAPFQPPLYPLGRRCEGYGYSSTRVCTVVS